MRRRERGDAEDMHVVLHSLARRLVGRRKERPDVDVEAEIGERRRDHLLPAVVAVLTDLGDQDARTAALIGLETFHQLAYPLDGAGHADLPLVDARNGPDFAAMA